MGDKIKICCLPVAGSMNPYQHLMIEGLKSNETEVFHGTNSKLFPFLKSCIKSRPTYIHLDWIHNYYITKFTKLNWLIRVLFQIDLILTKRFFNPKIVWTLHNIAPHGKLQDKTERRVRSYFAKYCTWIRVFNKETIEDASSYLGIDKSRFRAVPEGSYVEYYDRFIKSDKHTKKPEKFTLLFIGMIKPYKGIEKLISSFIKVRKEHWELVVAGWVEDKQYGKQLEKLCENCKSIKFIDKFIPEHELENYFTNCDVVVLPFEKIYNSGSVILAMGFKKPVVAPKMGAISNRLDAQTGLMYSNLEAGLENLKQYTPDELRSFGEKNYEQLKRFKWSDFLKLFKE